MLGVWGCYRFGIGGLLTITLPRQSTEWDSQWKKGWEETKKEGFLLLNMYSQATMLEDFLGTKGLQLLMLFGQVTVGSTSCICMATLLPLSNPLDATACKGKVARQKKLTFPGVLQKTSWVWRSRHFKEGLEKGTNTMKNIHPPS